ncbi:MAG: hypothetical protein R3293_26595, partial [Candidatus Promineifilaceae bacterium]|nr:hypothetical protein [Candidatus Promineifilaceae bacterium]
MDKQDSEMNATPEQQGNERVNAQDSAENSDRGEKNYEEHQEGRDGDVLAWIEGPAFNAPIEEMPTLQWPDDLSDVSNLDAIAIEQAAQQLNSEYSESLPVDEESQGDLENAMVWLEQLAAGQGTPLDEMPTLVSGGEIDEILPSEGDLDSIVSEIPGRTTILADDDSDPMAWLEQLAVDQSSPLEELPSVADRLLASEIVSQNDVDSSTSASLAKLAPLSLMVEEALDYLERLALAGGIELDNVNIEQNDLSTFDAENLNDLDRLSKTAMTIDRLDEEADLPARNENKSDWNELAGQIPDDPDEALAWLGALSEGVSDPQDSAELTDNPAVYGTSDELEHADAAADINTFEQMPEDPDEAMEWMKALADQAEDKTNSPDDLVIERELIKELVEDSDPVYLETEKKSPVLVDGQ